MQIDRKWLSKTAAEEGFVRDTLEKVYRLTRVLQLLTQMNSQNSKQLPREKSTEPKAREEVFMPLPYINIIL